jgi:hypothetical protein
MLQQRNIVWGVSDLLRVQNNLLRLASLSKNAKTLFGTFFLRAMSYRERADVPRYYGQRQPTIQTLVR